MSVSSIQSLPTADAAYIPLGGDGFIAPIAMYNFDHSETGDASAGKVQIALVMDQRYTSIIRFITLGIRQGTPAAADVRYLIGQAANQQSVRIGVTLIAQFVAATLNIETVVSSWVPPAQILPDSNGSSPRFDVEAENVLNDVYRVSAQILLFNINAREKVPLSVLMANTGPSGFTPSP